MYDLVQHVDRRAIKHQRLFDDLNGAHYPGAESSGIGEYRLYVNPPRYYLLCCIVRMLNRNISMYAAQIKHAAATGL